MRRAIRILWIMALAFLCAFAATAAMRVQAEIDKGQTDRSYPALVTREMNKMWVEFTILFWPSLAPKSADETAAASNSLDALKARNRASF